MAKYPFAKLVYPMGSIRDLPLNQTVESQNLKHNSTLVLMLGKANIAWDVNNTESLLTVSVLMLTKKIFSLARITARSRVQARATLTTEQLRLRLKGSKRDATTGKLRSISATRRCLFTLASVPCNRPPNFNSSRKPMECLPQMKSYTGRRAELATLSRLDP